MSGTPNFKARLDKRATTPAALFHKFRLAVAGSDTVHIVLEGYADVDFFSRILDQLLPGDGAWRSHVSFGKRNMDTIFALFRESDLVDRKVLFVRDSDFDAYLGRAPDDHAVFLTCGYSVENYVCTKENVERFVEQTLGVDRSEVNVEAIGQRFRDSVVAGFAWLSPIIAGALNAVKEGRQLNLDKIDVAAGYQTYLKTGQYPDEFSAEHLADAGFVDDDFADGVAAQAEAYLAQDAVRWLRGKYLIQFAAIYLQVVGAELHRRHRAGEILRFHRRANNNYQPDILFERLCRGTPTPVAFENALMRVAA